MANRQSYTWPTITTVVALLVLVIALPQNAKQWAPSFLRSSSFHLGLDLAGGTQLDFRISEREMEEQLLAIQREIDALEEQGISADRVAALQLQLQNTRDQKRTIVEAIRTVLERRINALGVSEAVITPSYIGNEKHLLVECPGVVNTQECIDTVGKTIQLEFKEEFTEATEEYEDEVRERVAAALKRITASGQSLDLVGEDLGTEIGVIFRQEQRSFQENLPEGLEDIWYKTPAAGVLERDGSITIPETQADGTVTEREVPGIFLVEVLRPRTETGRVVNDATVAFEILEKQEQRLRYNSYDTMPLADVNEQIAGALRTMKPGDLRTTTLEDGTARVLFLRQFTPGREEAGASHILVSYVGASSAGEDVTRTKEEALAFAQDLKAQLDAGANFEQLARTHSDGPSGKEGGSLGTFGRGAMVPPFEEAIWSMEEGEISDPVETQFGYHLIRTDKAPTEVSDIVKYEELVVRGEEADERAADIFNRLKDGKIEKIEEVAFLRTLFFSLLPTGWKDTLLDGKHFRTATITLDPVTSFPIVQISFNDEGGKLFQELTKRNIDKRIAIFVGGQLISAPVVQQEITGGTAIITGSGNFDEAKALAQDLNTGAIPAPIYLSGQRTVEATLGATALRTSLKAALIGIFILMVYMILVYRMLGLLADIALSIYALLFIALLKLPLFLFSDQYIVLTLAGMAGIILSIGMAVDANVLIFERMKEELRKGKMLKTAAETGFQRAWPSIRDGNVSTLITCTILFLIGTSIVKGFAITLGMGVLLSMFSAIVVTRWLLRKIAQSPLGENVELFGGRS